MHTFLMDLADVAMCCWRESCEFVAFFHLGFLNFIAKGQKCSTEGTNRIQKSQLDLINDHTSSRLIRSNWIILNHPLIAISRSPPLLPSSSSFIIRSMHKNALEQKASYIDSLLFLVRDQFLSITLWDLFLHFLEGPRQ